MAAPFDEDIPDAVLFACTHNAVRSPMAEALVKHFWARQIYVDSCGVKPAPLDGFAVAVLDELGIDLQRHRPKSFEDLEDTNYDLIVSLSPEAQHRAVEMTRTMAVEIEYWPTMDPSLAEGSREQRLDAYREVRDALYRRMMERFGKPRAPKVG